MAILKVYIFMPFNKQVVKLAILKVYIFMPFMKQVV